MSEDNKIDLVIGSFRRYTITEHYRELVDAFPELDRDSTLVVRDTYEQASHDAFHEAMEDLRLSRTHLNNVRIIYQPNGRSEDYFDPLSEWVGSWGWKTE